MKVIITLAAAAMLAPVLAFAEVDYPCGYKSMDRTLVHIQHVAREVVKTNLISPTSAEFPDWFDEVLFVKPDTYYVFGKVNASNVFGAILSQEFGVQLRCVSNDLIIEAVAFE